MVKFSVLLFIIASIALVRCDAQEVESKVKEIDKNKNGKTDQRIVEMYLKGVLVRTEMQYDSDEDGIPDVGYIKIFQDKKLIYFESWNRRFRDRQRSFHFENGSEVIEMDRDEDGIFEWVIMYEAEHELKAVLRRDKEGKLEALGETALEQAKRGVGIAKDLFRELDFSQENKEKK